MSSFLTFFWKKVSSLLYPALCVSLFIIFYACGETIHSSSETEETGSITFNVEWHGAPTTKDATSFSAARALDCNASGVATVKGEIYDQNNTYLAGGGPWVCEAHAGTIENVPTGTNRKAVILGNDSSGGIIYLGEKTGLTVIAGETNHAGVITVSLAMPVNVTATAGDEQVTIKWDNVSGAKEYRVYWSLWSGVSKDNHDGSIKEILTTTYTHIGLTNGTTYYYVVTAIYDYGESCESIEVNSIPQSSSISKYVLSPCGKEYFL